MKRILLVEDDPQISNLISLHLHEPFYAVTVCGKGASALSELAESAFNLIILDIMLPDLSGVEICRRVRERDKRTPILMLSSLAEETDKVMALELGADDYLTKPFGVFELMARVKALMRRGNQEPEPLAANAKDGVGSKGDDVMVRGELVIDKDSKKVVVRGQRLELTPKEFDLL